MSENGICLTMSEAAEVIGVKVYRVLYWCRHPDRYPFAIARKNAYGYLEMELQEAKRIKMALRNRMPKLGRPKARKEKKP